MPTAADVRLERLDIALGRMRRLWESPALKRRFVARLGLSIDPGLVRTLRAVRQSGPEPGVGDVATWLGVDNSTASRMVDGAESAGYLERRACERDRRRCLLSVTPEGTRILERIVEVREELLGELLLDWPDEAVDSLTQHLERLADGIADLEDRS